MVRVKCFFSWLWYFMTDGLYRMLGYFTASAVIWNMFIFIAKDHKNLLGGGNVVCVFFSVLGCVAGIFAAMIFSSDEHEEYFRFAPEGTARPFVSAAIAEFLKAAVSVWISAYTSILLCENLEIVSLHILVLMAVSYLFLYFSVGLLVGSLTENTFYRIVLCILYYLLSSSLSYVIFRHSDFDLLKILRYPFAYNAPLVSYDMYEYAAGCIVITIFPEGSFIQFFGLLFTACLFFIIAMIKFNKKSKAGSRAFSVQG